MSPIDELTQVVREWAKVFMHRSAHDMKKLMEDTDLSFSHISILMRLYHHGMSGVSAIGEDMSITNAAASQTVDKLVQLGYVNRSEDPIDRRAKRLELSDQGRMLVEKGIELRGRWIENLAAELHPEEQVMITSALTLLTEAALKIKDRAD